MDSYNTPVNAQTDEFRHFHPSLRPMCKACVHILEGGDLEHGFAIYRALAVLNGKPAFWQPAAHEHFAGDEVGQVRHE